MRSIATPLAPLVVAAGLFAASPSLSASAVDPLAGPLAPAFAQEEEAAPAKEPALLAIRAARLIVAPGREIENAIVLVRGDVIQAVGADVAIPEGTETVDAPVVCAGFVDAWSALGLDRGSLFDRSTRPSTSSVDGLEVYGDDYLRDAALEAGVTTVRSQIGLAGNVHGTSVALRLFPDLSDERAVLDPDAALAMQVLGNDALDRIGNVDRLLGQLESGAAYRKAQRKYTADLAEWEKKIAELEEELEKDFKKKKKDRDKEVAEAKEEGKEFKEERYKEDKKPRAPRYDADSEVLGAVAEGDLPLVLELHRIPEMRALLRRLPEFGRVRPILAGVSDARFVADELAAAGVVVIVNPTTQGEGGAFGSNHLELAADLDEAGVEVLFGSGGRDASATAALPLLAARAVAHGLSAEKALYALTLGPARALDLADRIGSVEVGKQADLLLLSGDPLSATTRVQHVLIAGEKVLSADAR
jgi:imidazolonepropionase-like amidohydrolase